MRAALAIGALFFSQATVAQQHSGDYARMSRASWSAFECSALADVLGKAPEHERLFRYGYDQGKAFVDAVRAGRVEQKDLHSIAPTGFLMLAQGPTTDFALGRVFEGAIENALKDVFTEDNVSQKDLQRAIASRKYSEANCEIIGRGL